MKISGATFPPLYFLRTKLRLSIFYLIKFINKTNIRVYCIRCVLIESSGDNTYPS